VKLQSKNTFKVFFIALTIILVGLNLGGCSKKASMTNKELTSEFTKNTESALMARSTVAKQINTKATPKGYVQVSKRGMKFLNEQKASVNKSLSKVSKSNTGVGKYPSNLVNYEKQILNYISVLQNKGTVKQAKSEFHKIVVQGQEINVKYQNMKENRYLNIATFSDQASGYKGHIPLTISPTDKNKKTKESSDKEPLSEQNKPKIRKANVINETTITISWAIWFFIICAVIIMSVFLQPNRSNDAMNALTESGGATLFNRPKPHGYELFLMRTTEISTIILVISLIVFNLRN
jgi:protein translocase SecG subunit